MLLSLWLLIGAQAPVRVALTTASRGDVNPQQVTQVMTHVAELLKQEGLAVLPVTLPCGSDRACQRAQGKQLQVEAVVVVTLASGFRRVAIDLEAITVATEAPTAQVTAGWKTQQPISSLDEGLRPFAAAVREKLAALRPKVPDRPERVAEPTLVPLPVAAAPVVVSPPAQRPSRAPEVVLGATAVGAGIAAAVLMGMASSDRNRLFTAAPQTFTRAEAQNLANTANGKYTGATIGAAAALALAVTAVGLWVAR